MRQKAAAQYFGQVILPWMKISEKVISIAPTETVRMEVRHLYQDFNYVMESGKWLHFEFESDRLRKKDLRRFREYESTTSAVHGVDVVTCVVSSHKCGRKSHRSREHGGKQKSFMELKTGISRYRVQLIWLKDYLVEEIFAGLEELAERVVEKKDLIPVALCPLFGGNMSMKERIVKGFQILKRSYSAVPEEDMRRLQAILYILALKFLPEKEMEEVKEAVGMSYLGQLIFDDGVKAGIEQGELRGIERGIIALILDNLEEGKTKDKILLKLQKRFGLEKEAAEEYWEKYSTQ